MIGWKIDPLCSTWLSSCHFSLSFHFPPFHGDDPVSNLFLISLHSLNKFVSFNSNERKDYSHTLFFFGDAHFVQIILNIHETFDCQIRMHVADKSCNCKCLPSVGVSHVTFLSLTLSHLRWMGWDGFAWKLDSTGFSPLFLIINRIRMMSEMACMEINDM